MPQATLFMPDISGFTKFLKETEQEHSRHIISELIKLIIQVGVKEFEVAEIEGDAVFFYKESVYDLHKVTSIAREIHARFHAHLSQYENKRICECGACTSAANLAVKFIVHQGDIGLIDYDGRTKKPFGKSVIEVHRLLKNKIGHKEYLLFSDSFLKGQDQDNFLKGEYIDAELGSIPFQYTLLDDWEKQTYPDTSDSSDQFDLFVSHDILVDHPSEDIHEMLVNFKYRYLWNKGVDEIIYEKDEINQAGFEHHCIVNGRELYFDTIKPQVKEGRLAYGEILKNPSPFSYLEINFLLDKAEIPGNTHITQITRVQYKSRVQSMLSFVFRKVLDKKAKDNLKNIKQAIPAFVELKAQHELSIS